MRDISIKSGDQGGGPCSTLFREGPQKKPQKNPEFDNRILWEGCHFELGRI